MVAVFRIAVFCMVICSSSALAWNELGHQLIAQIAYDEMTPRAKNLYESLFHQGKAKSFRNAAIWLDKIRAKHDPFYNDMHYIDIPFTRDGSSLPSIPPHNAVSAIDMATLTLLSHRETVAHKKEAMKILLHVIGDIHQPLHAATEVSHLHKDGDAGGNLFRLSHNKIAKNLHQYWDNGGGCLKPKHGHRINIEKIASELENQYPCVLGMDMDPMLWAKESHVIAVNDVYPTTGSLDQNYAINAQKITNERIARAGCRLSLWLNQIAAKTP